jgi:two-component system chemotaxis response regulator CheY
MPAFNGQRILIVDDEPFLRTTVRLVLRQVGRFEVADADDGETALAKIDKFRPDLILCDIGMGGMSGLDFVARLRRLPDPKLARTPVVMLTADADVATVQEAIKAGVNGYLVKPVSAKMLAARLEQLLPATTPTGG